MQRSRLLSAAVVTIAELGYEHASVAQITARARVSRRTFYDLFANREDCLLAILDDAVAQITGELTGAHTDGLSWRERIRSGLWHILCFLDRDPMLARICVAQTLHAGPRVLARREELLIRLAHVLDEGRTGDRAHACPPLTGEGLVGATAAVVYTRLSQPPAHEAPSRQSAHELLTQPQPAHEPLSRQSAHHEPLTQPQPAHEPLTGMFGELMSLITLPYLGSAISRSERSRPLPPLPDTVTAQTTTLPPGEHAQASVEHDPLADVPMRLTYRTARVLEAIALAPGASNRVVAERAGIVDQGQVSKLLARLQRLGLLTNTGEGHTHGEPNAWTLTPRGALLAQRLSLNTHDQHEVTQ